MSLKFELMNSMVDFLVTACEFIGFVLALLRIDLMKRMKEKKEKEEFEIDSYS